MAVPSESITCVSALVALGKNSAVLFDYLSAPREASYLRALINQESTVEVKDDLSLFPRGPGAWV